MRWNSLFDDLEAQLAQELAAEEVDVRGEEERLRLGRLALRDRLVAIRAAGKSAGHIGVTLSTGQRILVVPVLVGRDWMLTASPEDSRQCIVSLAGIAGLTLTAAQVRLSIRAAGADDRRGDQGASPGIDGAASDATCDTAIRDAAKREPTTRDVPKPQAGNREAFRPEAADRQPANRDAARPEAGNRDAPIPEAAEREATNRQGANCGGASRQPGSGDDANRAAVSAASVSADSVRARSPLAKGVGLDVILRDLCRRRRFVEVGVSSRTSGSEPVTMRGTIDRVGHDHVDLAIHENGSPRRDSAVSEYRVVPFSQLMLVRL